MINIATLDLLRRAGQILDAVYDNGCKFIDTADVYGDSEDLLGQWCEPSPYYTLRSC